MDEIERKERRERDRQARAMMSQIQNQEPEPECLFSAPPRVSVIQAQRSNGEAHTISRTWNLPDNQEIHCEM